MKVESLPLPPKKRRNQSQNSNGPPSQTAHQICLDMEKDSTFMCAPQPILHPHIGELQHSPLPPTPTATTFRRTHTDKWSPLIRMASRSPKTSRLHQPVEDVLYSVIAWFAKGGSHLNYYMWHGGTN